MNMDNLFCKSAFALFVVTFLCVSCSPSVFDDSEIWDKFDEMEQRIEELEKQYGEAKEDIEILKQLVEVLQNRDYITSVTPIMDGEDVVGYIITFAKSDSIIITNDDENEDSNSIIVGIEENENEVVFTLSDGSKIAIPKGSGNTPPPSQTDICEKLEDVEFMKYCYEKFDTNSDKVLSESEAKAIRAVNIDSKTNIYSVGGIEYFVNLESFQAYNAIALRTLDLSKNTNLRTVKEQALYKCSGLESVILPPTIETIEGDAFHDCHKLASINIPNGVTSIGSYAFAGDLQLTEIALPQSVKTIGKNAFSATGLRSLTLPEGISVVAENICFNCKSLTSLTLPSTTSNISYRAFSYCEALTEIYCKATTPPALEQYAFESVVANRKIYVPRLSVEAYKSSKYWSDYADNIVGYDFE